jgi:hypothetical protein
LPAALIFRLAFLAGFAPFFAALTFAHRALAAARILAMPAADIFRFLGAGPADSTGAPRMLFNSFCSDWIFSLMSAALRSSRGVALIIVGGESAATRRKGQVEFSVHFFIRGLSARSTRKVKPRPFSNGSTVAVTSRTR